MINVMLPINRAHRAEYPASYIVYNRLASEGPLSQHQLARQLNADSSVIYRRLYTLLKADKVERDGEKWRVKA